MRSTEGFVMDKKQSQHHHMTHGDHTHHEGHGQGGHCGHDAAQFRQRFWLSLLITISVLVCSPLLQQWLGYTLPEVVSRYVPAISGTILLWYGGRVFIRAGWQELRQRQPGMMLLIALAISVAYGYSLLVTSGVVAGMDFWWELASLITIMLLGHWLEMAAIKRATDAAHTLAQLLPETAEVVTEQSIDTVPLDHLAVGMTVLVRPGGRVPVDGQVISGTSQVDESMLTGESHPVAKQPGSLVTAGTINGTGALHVMAQHIGNDTTLSHIMELVRQAEQRRSRTQVLADRAAGYLFYAALATALVTGAGWALAGASLGEVLQRVVTVLVVACPHALGLAVPLVVSISTGLAAQRGIVVRDRRAFEAARQVDVVLFDKTGTLTTGHLAVVAVHGGDEAAILGLAAAAEHEAEHPIAAAIRRAAADRHVAIPAVRDLQTVPGYGVQAVVDGVPTLVGNAAFMQQHQIDRDEITTDHTVVYVAQAGRVCGVIELGDAPRPGAAAAVAALQRRGITVAMVTGDGVRPADAIARLVGITEVHAEVTPAKKAAIVMAYQQQGKRVCFVGDGVNDAPALAQAESGVAIGTGTDVAAASAGIMLVGDDPQAVVRLITLAQATYRKMVQNLCWGAGYNVLMLPLAAGVLAPVGVVISPAIGAVVMSLSTIIVAANAQFLRRAVV